MPTLRPTFELPVPGSRHEVMERLRHRLRDSTCCHGMSVGDHAELFLPPGRRRPWSPWLSVTAEEKASGVSLRGRFSPHPAAWTLTLFLLFSGGFTVFVGLVWGLAQWSLDLTPWALLAVPAAAVVMAGVLTAARAGQRLAAGDMVLLREAVERLVESAPEIERTGPTTSA